VRDGINLSIKVYLPNEGGKFPALLALSAYGKEAMTPGVAPSAESAEQASYLLAPIVSSTLMGMSSHMRIDNPDVPKWMGG
jgi:predicted acyl esterase